MSEESKRSQITKNKKSNNNHWEKRVEVWRARNVKESEVGGRSFYHFEGKRTAK